MRDPVRSRGSRHLSPSGSRLALAALGLAACGRLDFDPLGGPGDAHADGGDGDGAIDAQVCAGFGPWGTPRRLTELASTAKEFGGQIMADNLTLYFDRHGTVADEIFVATRPDRSSPFGPPIALGVLGTGNSNGSATVTPDGLELYFESSRSGTVCIYRSSRADTASPWGAPTGVTGLCSSATEGAFITADGLTLYYNTATPPTDYEGTISVTTRPSRAAAFGPGSPISELIPGATKGYCARSADGLTLYFESGAPTDLWETSRSSLGMPFGTPSPIAGINTSSIEQDVSITTDGTELFFASDRPGSLDLDLYVATRSCL